MGLILFSDKDDKPIKVVSGGISNPETYEDPSLPIDKKWKEISEEEFKQLFPPRNLTGGRMQDPLHEQIKTLRDKHDTLLSVLEDELKLPKGNLLEKIDLKIKEQGK